MEVDDLYASLNVETCIVVQQRTSEIKTLMRRTAQDIIEIGQKLIEVKEKLGHGLFGAWLHTEFEWTQKTAERFVNVAQRFGNRQFVDFDMAPSALYLLTAPSAPESAREDALLRVENGEQITHRVAMTYTFDAQKAKGDAGELFLDRWFAAEYEVRRSPPYTPDQLAGLLDRLRTTLYRHLT